MTARKHWFRVPDSVLWDDLTNDELAALIRLQAFLNIRWARNGLTPEEACRADLTKADLHQITRVGRTRHSVPRLELALRKLCDNASITPRFLGDIVSIHWPKYAEFQEYKSCGRPETLPSAPAPAKEPSYKPSRRKRRVGTYTVAPDQLTPEDHAVVAEWLTTVWPGGAADMEASIEDCLHWHRANGVMRVDWPSSVIRWIRKGENDRRVAIGQPKLKSVAERLPIRRAYERMQAQMEAEAAAEQQPKLRLVGDDER